MAGIIIAPGPVPANQPGMIATEADGDVLLSSGGAVTPPGGSAGTGGGGAAFAHPDPNPVTLANGAEVAVTHAAITAHGILASIIEQLTATGALATATHTGYSSATGTASADSDGYQGNLYAWQALAGSLGWHNTTAVACYWQYVFASAQIIASLTLQCADGNGPTSFNFKGSNDGTTWTTLLTQSGLSWGASEQKSFTLTTTGSYTYYRLECTAAQWIYLTKIHMIAQGAVTYEACTIGNYASSQQFGLKRNGDTSTKIKNMSGAQKTVFINVVTE